ncbi:MAG: hypothetical protein IKP48_08240 [Bacteroidaceae bacterium]|nr:hypothetical protein [Bacteroidaceae bacterium]
MKRQTIDKVFFHAPALMQKKVYADPVRFLWQQMVRMWIIFANLAAE